MDENELQKKTRQAVAQMREMNMRANSKGNSKKENSSSSNKDHLPPKSENQNKSKEPSCTIPKKDNTLGRIANSPFSNLLIKDNDTVLIVGLLLILMSEKADKILLFALIYILS